MIRRAKIVCTLGPASTGVDSVAALIAAGMDVARLNFSHGTHAEHAASYRNVREAQGAFRQSVGVLADLQGAKIRLGAFDGGSVVWSVGQRVVITTEDVLGTPDQVSTTYAGLAEDVSPGDRVLVDDGNLALEVLSCRSPDVECRVLEGGRVSDHKGIALPDIDVNLPALSEKDVVDLKFALSLNVDMIALSFVRKAEDAVTVRDMMRESGRNIGIVAKIERVQAVDHLEEIIAAFDGIMLARGDLGVETPLEQVPLVQKRAIRLAREAGKAVIVATQMLESMITHSRPTRAEASDVATAVFDGADALMLSAETSVGLYPKGAVATMSKIIEAAETEAVGHAPAITVRLETASAALARAATEVARDVDASALVAFTQTGATARRLARHRPAIPIIAFTPHPLVRNQLSLIWGVETFIAPTVTTTDDMVCQVDEALQASRLAASGDRVVIVAGTPTGQTGTTNTVRVHRIGSISGS